MGNFGGGNARREGGAKRSFGGRGGDSGGRFGGSDRGGSFSGGDRPRSDFGPREMHDAICAECGQGCQVPFKPIANKPVYCRDCFNKRKPF